MWVRNSELSKLIHLTSGNYFSVEELENGNTALYFVTSRHKHEIDVSDGVNITVWDYLNQIEMELKERGKVIDVWDFNN